MGKLLHSRGESNDHVQAYKSGECSNSSGETNSMKPTLQLLLLTICIYKSFSCILQDLYTVWCLHKAFHTYASNFFWSKLSWESAVIVNFLLTNQKQAFQSCDLLPLSQPIRRRSCFYVWRHSSSRRKKGEPFCKWRGRKKTWRHHSY